LTPSDPNDFPAGSAEKIELMRNRRLKKLPLFSTGDTLAKVDQRPDPEPPILFAQLERLHEN